MLSIDEIKNQLQVGARVYVENEKLPYTVRAWDHSRYAVCTKPFAAIKNCIYFIIDLKRGVRGPHNLVFNSYDFMAVDNSGIDELMHDMILGPPEQAACDVVEVSYRRQKQLDIVKINPAKLVVK